MARIGMRPGTLPDSWDEPAVHPVQSGVGAARPLVRSTAVAGVTRRTFLAEGALAASAAFLAPRRGLTARAAGLAEPRPEQAAALRALGRTTMRLPDSLPHAALPVGTDTVPQIEHVVVLMLENHSFDNFFG